METLDKCIKYIEVLKNDIKKKGSDDPVNGEARFILYSDDVDALEEVLNFLVKVKESKEEITQ